MPSTIDNGRTNLMESNMTPLMLSFFCSYPEINLTRPFSVPSMVIPPSMPNIAKAIDNNP